ncbi:MAG: hypothetical protein KGI29_03595 [Pseudomonadota bacterium]|nr:hypothetical protein [Pseudomonadota bacterium]MDE3037191.1 hypothetical protein [Pseudomonadota bacterium]
MSKPESVLRLIIEVLDIFVFFWLAIRGMMFIWDGGGGYLPFWGCALISTAVFWKKYDKGAMVTALKDSIKRVV